MSVADKDRQAKKGLEEQATAHKNAVFKASHHPHRTSEASLLRGEAIPALGVAARGEGRNWERGRD